MKIYKSQKKLIWAVVICLCIPLVVLAIDSAVGYTVTYEENTYALSVVPEENAVGFAVGAEDMANILGWGYEYDEAHKVVTFSVDGTEIMLMHNATHYYYGDESLECEPEFYVASAPMIELGFFCELAGLSYTVDGNNIKLESNVATLDTTSSVKGSLNFEAAAPTGLAVEFVVQDVSVYEALYGDEYTVEGTYHTGKHSVTPGATSFSYTLDTTPYFGDCYTVYLKIYLDNELKAIRGVTSKTSSEVMDRIYSYYMGSMQLFKSGGQAFSTRIPISDYTDTNVYGTVKLPAPVDSGLEVSFIAREVIGEHSNYYGEEYYATGDSYYFNESLVFNEGEQTKTFNTNVDDLTYENFLLYVYTLDNPNVNGLSLVTQSGEAVFADSLLDTIFTNSTAKLFRSNSSTEVEITLPEKGNAFGDLKWKLDGTTLTVFGSGRMDDFVGDVAPWNNYSDIITQVVVSDGVLNIGDDAFSNLPQLISVSIADSVVSIGWDAFEDCAKLERVVLPEGLERIDSFAFYGCRAMSYIYIPESVTKIGTSAFYGCSDLTVIGYKGSVAETYAQSNSISFEAVEGSVFYTVTYDANGGVNAPVPQKAVTGMTVAVTNAQPIRDGYEFMGWSSTKNGGVEYNAGDLYTDCVDITLYAVWGSPDCIVGDANDDGEVDLKDVTTLRRYLAGGYGVSLNLAASDINGDGEVDLKDVTTLRRYLAGGYGVELN